MSEHNEKPGHNATPGLLDDYLTRDETGKEIRRVPRTLKRWEEKGTGRRSRILAAVRIITSRS
jgi:hypothetical protein